MLNRFKFGRIKYENNVFNFYYFIESNCKRSKAFPIKNQCIYISGYKIINKILL